ncbi:hypothetical protein SASPL_117937 [Salvia splendens]|uniref:Uncharacterized protein n=1 Tax=Salvia splendens TaxID=180675 RepID=A0A8X8XVV6_SALSN|nr:hypothetical protein SASPL_117937 [Salvia splendens]
MHNDRGVIADRSRRCWTQCEESILLSNHEGVGGNQMEVDNGFRAGYLIRALEPLKCEFPKTDICVYPHIKSMITVWKNNNYSLLQIVDRSGVGFNVDGDYKIDIDDEQWEQVVHKDSNAKYMRNKSWPIFDDWKKEIFGKDHAKGSKVMDTGDAVSKIYGTKVDLNENSAKSSPMTLEELFPDEVFPNDVLPKMVDESTSAPVRVTPRVPNKVTKKRKTNDKI